MQSENWAFPHSIARLITHSNTVARNFSGEFGPLRRSTEQHKVTHFMLSSCLLVLLHPSYKCAIPAVQHTYPIWRKMHIGYWSQVMHGALYAAQPEVAQADDESQLDSTIALPHGRIDSPKAVVNRSMVSQFAWLR